MADPDVGHRARTSPGEKQLPIPDRARSATGASIRLVGARAHNLKNVTAEIPIGLFTCVTGVSGSGKSSLIVDTLLPAARATLYSRRRRRSASATRIEGLEHIDKVDLHRSSADRPHAALQPRDVHGRVLAPARALRRAARGARARLQGRAASRST